MNILAQDEPAPEVVNHALINKGGGYTTPDASTFTATGIILFFIIVACVLFMKFIHRQKSVAILAKEMKKVIGDDYSEGNCIISGGRQNGVNTYRVGV